MMFTTPITDNQIPDVPPISVIGTILPPATPTSTTATIATDITFPTPTTTTETAVEYPPPGTSTTPADGDDVGGGGVGSNLSLLRDFPLNVAKLFSRAIRTHRKTWYPVLLDAVGTGSILEIMKFTLWDVTLSFFDHVLQSRDSGFAFYIVYFDFTKAFDRVDHALILLKLSSFGIYAKFLNLISSYLSSHVQHVISNPARVRSGVIQGSVLIFQGIAP
ncbi:unnamed protein product [Schistocephalus solidus]|uniref:Reverse transcriptase domain-containing protein n=1 Tax=Schistocephalus solidus TaxID=70667 RepID=A0A183SN14_SCHSO|nr:unnamed protein product [Schistocephalus solidus]